MHVIQVDGANDSDSDEDDDEDEDDEDDDGKDKSKDELEEDPYEVSTDEWNRNEDLVLNDVLSQ